MLNKAKLQEMNYACNDFLKPKMHEIEIYFNKLYAKNV